MDRLTSWLWRYRYRVFAGFLTLLVVDGAELLVPLIVRRAINGLAQGKGDLVPSVVYIAVLAVVVLIFRFLWRYFFIGTARRIERDLRERFYDHLLVMPASFYNERKTGDLMAHATNDIEAVSRACGFGILTIADPLFMIPIAIGVMLSISRELTLWACLPLPVLALFMFGYGRVVHRLFEKVQETFSAVMEKVRENVSGIRVVKSFVQEKGTERDFDGTNRLLVDRNMKLVRLSGLFDPFIELVGGAALAAVLWIGGRGVILGSMSLGDLVAFWQYVSMLVWPMLAIGWAVNLIQRGRASLERVNRLLAVAPEIVDPPNPVPLSGTRLEFRNLSFAYPSRNGGEAALALSGIDLVVEEGTTLGVVGLTGSGKTSLVQLVPRVFDPPSGTLFVGGTDVREFSLKDLRRAVGFVPQEALLFSATIRENIAFGVPDATEEAVREAARLAGIDAEIEGFPNGYETVVGERGIALSGGQKQRVAIARALLLQPRVLILDDPLSAVDAEKEELVLSNLRAFFRGRTCLLVAHRLSAVMHADRIVVLDGGRVVETGTHAELVGEDGIYRRIWDLQQAERRVTLG